MEAKRPKRRIHIAVRDLLFAGLILFGVNVVVAIWFIVSPNMMGVETVNAEDAFHAPDPKASPFYHVEPERVSHKRVKAQRIVPILEEIQPDPAVLAAEPANSPYVTGAQVYQVLEMQMNKLTEATHRFTEPLRRATDSALRQVDRLRRTSEPLRALEPIR